MNHRIRATRPTGDWPPPCPSPVHDPDILAGYLEDASRLRGHASSLYRPRDTAEVAGILHHLSREGIPVTVVAKQTSTTGSSVPQGGAILSMERLTRFLILDPSAARATAEGGIILGDFQQTLEDAGWLYPPDPTSRSESTLGASVACNASGARSFKYGPTRPYIRRLQVVLSDGSLLDVARGAVTADEHGRITIERPMGGDTVLQVPNYPRPRVKHAAGYHSSPPGEPPLDLIDLFIGSEGTLGVITQVEVRLIPKPARVISILATWPDECSALTFVKRARGTRDRRQIDPRCLEWLDANALRLIAAAHPNQAPPADGAAVFFEQECTEADEDGRLEAWYDLLVETGARVAQENGVMVADTEARQAAMYDMRHAVPAGLNERAARNGMPKLGTDLAVPDEALDEIMAIYGEAVADVPASLGLEACAALIRALLSGKQARSEGERCWSTAQRRAAKEALESPSIGAGSVTQGLEAMRRLWDELELPTRFEHAIFGHIGDNHLHVNLLPTGAHGLAVAKALYERLTERAIALGGTVSAEHGVGKNKRRALELLLGSAAIEQMARLKQALDPAGILGRGNLFETGHLRGAIHL